MYDNLFYKNLSKDKEKLKIFKEGLKKEIIRPFDISTLSKLRRLYYSCYSALIYLYGEETNFETIGNKVELLSFVFENDSYQIVHAETDSTRDIPFHQYAHKHLDFNSYYEVQKGNKTLIYDTFSMLMFDKEIYEQLEHPKIIRTVSKQKIQSHPMRIIDRETYNNPHDFWLSIPILTHLERNLENNPYKAILKKELERYKVEINYEELILKKRRKELETADSKKRK